MKLTSLPATSSRNIAVLQPILAILCLHLQAVPGVFQSGEPEVRINSNLRAHARFRSCLSTAGVSAVARIRFRKLALPEYIGITSSRTEYREIGDYGAVEHDEFEDPVLPGVVPNYESEKSGYVDGDLEEPGWTAEDEFEEPFIAGMSGQVEAEDWDEDEDETPSAPTSEVKTEEPAPPYTWRSTRDSPPAIRNGCSFYLKPVIGLRYECQDCLDVL